MLSEMFNMRTMAPRLCSNLIPASRGETARPLEAWIRFRYTLNRIGVYQILASTRII